MGRRTAVELHRELSRPGGPILLEYYITVRTAM